MTSMKHKEPGRPLYSYDIHEAQGTWSMKQGTWVATILILHAWSIRNLGGHYTHMTSKKHKEPGKEPGRPLYSYGHYTNMTSMKHKEHYTHITCMKHKESGRPLYSYDIHEAQGTWEATILIWLPRSIRNLGGHYTHMTSMKHKETGRPLY